MGNFWLTYITQILPTLAYLNLRYQSNYILKPFNPYLTYFKFIFK